ncbi:MspA family porin [Gordonia sp. CPCC 206044]|uniref:MspA family porin n=1 Tax=Gordonia sp. CPCC 206044 TaxID=3140793 RepID=UPI003AF34C58
MPRRTTTAAAAIGVMAVCAIAATPDASAGRLANGYKKVSDGAMVVQTWRSGEYAAPQNSMAANGIGRSAILSGTIVAKVSKGEGKLRVGYLVGCQVAVGTLTAGVSGTIAAAPSLSGSLSFPLAPGEIKAVQLSTQNIKSSARYQYSGLEVEVQGCGGHAQARSYAKVEAVEGYSIGTATSTNIGGSGAYVQSTLLGQPFSLN